MVNQTGHIIAEEVRKRVAQLVASEKSVKAREEAITEKENKVKYREEMVSNREKRIFGKVMNE